MVAAMMFIASWLLAGWLVAVIAPRVIEPETWTEPDDLWFLFKIVLLGWVSVILALVGGIVLGCDWIKNNHSRLLPRVDKNQLIRKSFMLFLLKR